MGQTIAEKIISAHVGREVIVGEIVKAKVDFAYANDITAPLAINHLENLGLKKVFDPERVGLIPDHFAPNKDIKSAEQCKKVREFAKKYGIKNYFEVGRMGIEHVLLPEEGIALPGMLIVGADSHTCTLGAFGAFATGVGSTDFAAAVALGEVWLKVPETIKFIYYGKMGKWVTSKDLILYTIGKIGVAGATYKVMEFTGEVINNLSMDARATITNMAIEAGGKTGIIEPDDVTEMYIKDIAKWPYKIYKSDKDAQYAEVYEFDVSKIEPQVAFPHLPENTKPISEVGNIKIDQAFIGSCTNGKLEDLELAAQILKGKKIHPDVRMIVIPATPKIYREAMRRGLIDIFMEAGATVSAPTCGPCLGGHMGVLAKGEKAISTTNRNFVGRMGHPESEVYLASPAIAAASAILGRIGSPEEVEL